jgi:hypothetical protein
MTYRSQIVAALDLIGPMSASQIALVTGIDVETVCGVIGSSRSRRQKLFRIWGWQHEQRAKKLQLVAVYEYSDRQDVQRRHFTLTNAERCARWARRSNVPRIASIFDLATPRNT